jgi:hypothetical protein
MQLSRGPAQNPRISSQQRAVRQGPDSIQYVQPWFMVVGEFLVKKFFNVSSAEAQRQFAWGNSERRKDTASLSYPCFVDHEVALDRRR